MPYFKFQQKTNTNVLFTLDLKVKRVWKGRTSRGGAIARESEYYKYKGIANVLKHIYDNPKYWSVEGGTIRHFLKKKGLNVPHSLSNRDLGKLFDFGGGNSNTLTIEFSDYAKKYITNFQHYDGKYGTSLFTDLVKLKKLYDILKGRPVDFSNNKKPCIGDPVPNPEIVSSGASGKKGGTFGCTRKDKTTCNGIKGKKRHDGLDIKSEVNKPVYATHNGIITGVRNSFSPGQYKYKSYGNYIIITFKVNGISYNIKYNHMNEINVKVNDKVRAGDIIGLSGNTGNAAKKAITPHIHLQVFNSDWSKKIDPKDFIKTKFDSKYNPIKSTCN